MLNDARRSLAQRINSAPARLLARTGIAPNHLTIFGLLLSLAVAWILSDGRFLLGGILVLASGAFDLLDGALARASGRVTKFGAILDSTFDRFSEAALFLGLTAFYAASGSYAEVLLIAASIVGSMTTSYVRARAEALGIKCEVGVFTRPERVVLLAVGLILDHTGVVSLLVLLWIMAVLSNLIAWQRLFHVWRQTRGQAAD